MDKLWAILALFRQGNAVADPALWKNGGITVALLIPVLLAVGRVADSFGWPIFISESDAASIATAVLAISHIVLTVISSKSVGLPPRAAPVPPASPSRFGDGTA